MPTKKAAKKAAKKSAKKAAHRHASHDLRRAYEHLGRIEILDGALASRSYSDVTTLAQLAQHKLATGEARDSADLLRAAEHMAFAALAPSPINLAQVIPADLKAAITAEFEGLILRAEHHRERAAKTPRSPLSALYSSALHQARTAFARAAYRPALEFARAAEAIAHVTGHPAALPAGGKQTHRLAS